MIISKVAVAVAAAGLAAATFADVAVKNVTVQQRWPWNGKVDIDYEVTSDSAEDSVFVYPTGLETDRNIAIAPRTLSGDGVTDGMIGARVKPGKHRMTWDMGKDEPTLHSSAFTVTMHAVKGGMYLVIDLTGGTDATTFPFRYSDTPPSVAVTDDSARTTNLWLRLCLPGTFMMGSPSDELGHWAPKAYYYDYHYEDLHPVTLTKPFYIGVFETTQKQYELVTGKTPSNAKGDTRPVEQVSYDDLRGSIAGAAYPAHSQVDPDSFFGILRAKTGIMFDLPTEAQWEYACRAGTSTALNSGKNLTATGKCENVAEVGRYDGNRSDARGGFLDYTTHTVVGLYKPNAWGLYDMHGNVSEICLDWFQERLGNSAVENPIGGTQCAYYDSHRWRYGRTVKGGDYYSYGVSVRSASRANGEGGSYTCGFRLVAIPVVVE